MDVKLSLETILGYAFMPLALVMGVPWKDAFAVGDLLGTRMVLNELIAYSRLGAIKDTLDPAHLHDRHLRAVRLRQLQLDRHPDRRHRRPGPRAPRRPRPPRPARAARRHLRELHDRLHRGGAAVSLVERLDEAAGFVRARTRAAAGDRRRARLRPRRLRRRPGGRGRRALRRDPPLPRLHRRRAHGGALVVGRSRRRAGGGDEGTRPLLRGLPPRRGRLPGPRPRPARRDDARRSRTRPARSTPRSPRAT